MFILKKLIAPFALPPGIFVVFLVLAGFWALRRKNRPAACISLVCAVFFWTFSISPTSDLLMGGLEKGLVIPSVIEADVILMLGGSIYEKSPDISGQGAPGPDTMMRLVTAARLHHPSWFQAVKSFLPAHPSRLSPSVSWWTWGSLPMP